MSNINEAIEAADKLYGTLDRAAANEIKFNTEICMDFEQMSYDVYKIANHLKEINELLGI